VFQVEEKRQRQYDAEFKKEVLKMTMEGKPIVDGGAGSWISPERIYKWRRDEKLRIGAVAFASAGGKALTPEEELRAIREELETTKRERDILKKALAIFSKEPQTR
jgi:Transposase.